LASSLFAPPGGGALASTLNRSAHRICHCKVALSEWHFAIGQYRETVNDIKYEEAELKETAAQDIRAGIEKELARSRELLKTRTLVLLQRASMLSNRATYYPECARFIEQLPLCI
jgi:uncharacterized protein YfaP (DUF2135 family)